MPVISKKREGYRLSQEQRDAKAAQHRAYRTAKRKLGLKEILLWVPEQDIDAVKRYAERKRQAFLSGRRS